MYYRKESYISKGDHGIESECSTLIVFFSAVSSSLAAAFVGSVFNKTSRSVRRQYDQSPGKSKHQLYSPLRASSYSLRSFLAEARR
jgi:hypothetical protein